MFDIAGISSHRGAPKKGVCPDHPEAGVKKVWIEEQLKPGVVDWCAVQARLREQGIALIGGGADEEPEVYKRLPDVHAPHDATIRLKHTLCPLGIAMAGRDVYDPQGLRDARAPLSLSRRQRPLATGSNATETGGGRARERTVGVDRSRRVRGGSPLPTRITSRSGADPPERRRVHADALPRRRLRGPDAASTASTATRTWLAERWKFEPVTPERGVT